MRPMLLLRLKVVTIALFFLWPALAMGQSFDVLWYDNGEEATLAGSIREHLVERGHRVTYVRDGGGEIDVSTAEYDAYDVIVAEHTAGAGSLVGLESWFDSGRGYVVLVGPSM